MLSWVCSIHAGMGLPACCALCTHRRRRTSAADVTIFTGRTSSYVGTVLQPLARLVHIAAGQGAQLAAHAPGHLLARPHLPGVLAAANATRRSVRFAVSVRGRLPRKPPALHHPLEPLANRGACKAMNTHVTEGGLSCSRLCSDCPCCTTKHAAGCLKKTQVWLTKGQHEQVLPERRHTVSGHRWQMESRSCCLPWMSTYCPGTKCAAFRVVPTGR